MVSKIFEEYISNISLKNGNISIKRLREGLVGEGALVPGLDGTTNPLIYADYLASGRALQQVENFVSKKVLPYYANSHTEASYCGSYITRLREAARSEIARICNASHKFSVIFTGSGSTSGFRHLLHLYGLNLYDLNQSKTQNPVVFIGPYEHHSNILPWRESGAEVIEIPESSSGGPDLASLEAGLKETQGRFTIGAFSVASNVTGIVTDVDAVSRVLNLYGAVSIWDCAGSGPYLPIDMKEGTDAQKDAVVISTHKFIGGPASSGVMIVRNRSVRSDIPTLPGGGTVRFVSPWRHDYSDKISTREEAGTPNIIGDIRAGLCFLVKEAMGQDYLNNRLKAIRQQVLSAWSENPHIHILGNKSAKTYLPVFSFCVSNKSKKAMVHQQLFTRMLSDIYGLQVRGGCACAGPYAHRLLDINKGESDRLRANILSGHEIEKPGWVRVSFSPLMDDQKVATITKMVNDLANNVDRYADLYDCDENNARFKLRCA